MSLALARYRGRMAERKAIMTALLVRCNLLHTIRNDLEKAQLAEPARIILRMATEADRIRDMIRDMPQPTCPKRRRRKR